MAEFKLVISDPKSGKSLQREVKEDAANALIGKKIGEAFKGEAIDLPGYEFIVTGGSDASGFPMRWDVEGSGRKQITTVSGVGVKNKLRKPNPKKKGWRTINGMRLKKTVAGNTVHAKTAQVNLKITKMGREKLFEDAKPEEAAPAKENKPEAKAPSKEKKGGSKKVEESKTKPKQAPEEVIQDKAETVPERAEEVPEKVEEVPITHGSGAEMPEPMGLEDDSDSEGEAVTPAEHSKAMADESVKSTKAAAAAQKTGDDFDELDDELKKDEEDIKKEDEEIEKLEKELEKKKE